MSEDTNDPADPPPLVRTTPDTANDPDDWDKWDAEDQSKKLKALFVNRIFVQPDGLHLRITFGERIGEESVYHTSIVVPNADALEMGRLILNMAELSLNHQLAFYRNLLDKADAEPTVQESDGGASG